MDHLKLNAVCQWPACAWVVLAIPLVLSLGGCNTLSSLGFPVGTPGNQLLRSADRISEAPGRAIDLPRELNEQPMPEHLVEVGDVLLVEPVRFESEIRLPGDQTVKPDGTISLGEFGQYYAVGKTISQIEAEIQDRINQQQTAKGQRQSSSPQSADQSFGDGVAEQAAANEITVRLVSWESQKFYVLGEVNSPGSFLFDGNETVLDALVDAGGMTSGANGHKILVSRPTPSGSCRIVLKVCYDQIVQLGDTSTNYQIEPGDRVFVPSLSLWQDITQSLFPFSARQCPRCAERPIGCQLPTQCASPTASAPLEVE